MVNNVEYYEVTASKNSMKKVIYRGPAQSMDLYEIMDRLQIEAKN
jgi:hypothetical protein